MVCGEASERQRTCCGWRVWRLVANMTMNEAMRVIVTGTGGRLGGAVARHLRLRGHRVVAWDRKAVDLGAPERIDDHFGAAAYDAVVHCAAATSLEWCELNPEEAAVVNAEAAGRIARHCREQGARMVQVSTDYVYDGTVPGLRRECDLLAPCGVYARTKLAGERAVLESGARVVVARVSWVFGPDRPAFPDQLIERARREETCAAIGDKWSTPCYSVDLAEQIEGLLWMEDVEGVFNLGNTGECTWQEYGQAALDLVSEMGIPLRCRTVGAQTLAEMTGFLAPRPVHTAMDLTKLRALGIPARPWREALADYLATYYRGRDGQSAE